MMINLENQKPTSIKTVGLIVAILSGFIIFSNGLGALSFLALGMDDQLQNQPEFVETYRSTNPMALMFDYYVEIGMMMVIIGVLFLIGGIFLRKYKMWANKLVSIVSVVLFILIWVMMIAMSISAYGETGMLIFSIGAIVTAAFWSIPLGFLIHFLNKKKIKMHFE